MVRGQVYLHYSVRDGRDALLQSTWAEEGGPGVPEPFILGGKGSRRMPRGWELALLSKLESIMNVFASSHSQLKDSSEVVRGAALGCRLGLGPVKCTCVAHFSGNHKVAMLLANPSYSGEVHTTSRTPHTLQFQQPLVLMLAPVALCSPPAGRRLGASSR